MTVEDIVIGNYKIESMSGRYGTVHKALGPWPLTNWSWCSFYVGTIEECKKYIEWAQRIDSRDQNLIKDVAHWYSPEDHVISEKFYEHILHFPKIMGYDFNKALELHPRQPEERSPEVAFFVMAIVVVIMCITLYHMM